MPCCTHRICRIIPSCGQPTFQHGEYGITSQIGKDLNQAHLWAWRGIRVRIDLSCQPLQIVHVQGLAACTGCRSGCYQCAPVHLAKGEHTVLTWDMGEIFGASNPTSLPSPTTSSLSRTVLMWPEAGLYSRLHINDAERAQGLKAGHTALLERQARDGRSGHADCRSARFKCVGNAMPGEVSSAHRDPIAFM